MKTEKLNNDIFILPTRANPSCLVNGRRKIAKSRGDRSSKDRQPAAGWSFIKLNPWNISVVQIPPPLVLGRQGGGHAIVKIPRGLDALEIHVINRRNFRVYAGESIKNASNAYS